MTYIEEQHDLISAFQASPFVQVWFVSSIRLIKFFFRSFSSNWGAIHVRYMQHSKDQASLIFVSKMSTLPFFTFMFYFDLFQKRSSDRIRWAVWLGNSKKEVGLPQ